MTIAGKHVVLAFPQTYVNLSGEAVAKLVRRHSIDDPKQIVHRMPKESRRRIFRDNALELYGLPETLPSEGLHG